MSTRVDLYLEPPPLVWPSGAVEPLKKVSECWINDF
jgi:hypothetical protein